MKRVLLAISAGLAISAAAIAQDTSDYPPNADAGACFARVLITETTEVVTEQVEDQPQGTEIRVIPASYETVTEQVLIKEESIEYTVIPAVYETVTVQMIESPERTETVVIPAVYETYAEQVLIRPAYTTWKPGAGLYGRNAAGLTDADAAAMATGELLCRVEVPAQYDTVTRTRIKTPGRTETKVMPATYRTITRQVVSQPARVEQTMVPAVYEAMTVQKLVEPAREEVVVIPATYKTVEKRVVTGGGGLEWREVLCDTNASPQKIAEIQRALTAVGYEVPDDGSFGPATLQAMEAYQRANGLPVGYLTVSTVESLGISPY